MNINTEILSGDGIPICTLLNQWIISSFGVKCNAPDAACGVDLALNDAITTGNFLMLALSGDTPLYLEIPHSYQMKDGVY